MPASIRKRSIAALPLVLTGTLVAGSLAGAPTASAASRQHRIGNGMDIVRNQKGDPYKYGAEGPKRFDCSGLVYYSFRKAGFHHVPRSSSSQAHFVNRLKKRSSMRVGDFVFFYDGSAAARNVYHVGVFAGWRDGHRVIVHAPYRGADVRREQIWTNHWFPGTLRGM
jgi:cell wall-associated NlpC family hydrolase